MKDSALSKIQGWFEKLDHKVEELRSEVREDFSAIRIEMVTKQQFENRFQALLTAMSNLHDRVESYKEQIRQKLH